MSRRDGPRASDRQRAAAAQKRGWRRTWGQTETRFHIFSAKKKNADVIIITRQAVQRAAFCVCHRSPPPSSVSSIVFLVVSEADWDALSSFLVFLLWSVFQPFCLLHPVQVFGPARRTPNGLGLIAALTAGVP